MQNDRLDLTIILAEKNRKKMLCSQRYLHFFEDFSLFVLPISLTTKHFLPIFFSKNDRKIEPVTLYTIPYELNRIGDDFLMVTFPIEFFRF